MAIDYCELTSHLYSEWLDICSRNFPNTSRQFFDETYENDPSFKIADILIAHDRRQPIGGVRTLRRKMHVNGQYLNIGGITDFCVDQQYRNHSVFIDLLRLAIDKLDACSDLIVGFTHLSSEKVISRFGFTTIPLDYSIIDAEEINISSQYSIRPFDAIFDLPVAVAMYEEFAGNYNGTLLRDDAYWKTIVLPQMKHSYVLTREEKVVAYITCSPYMNRHTHRGAVWIVKEYAQKASTENYLPLAIALLAKHLHLPRFARAPAPLVPFFPANPERKYAMKVRLGRAFSAYSDVHLFTKELEPMIYFDTDRF